MSLFIASLNSGSNGNCYYVGNSEEAILVDVGISCKEVEKRMARLGLPLNRLKAIFISHEHTDHISGVEVLSRKLNLPVYITDSTLASARLKLDKNLRCCFNVTPVQIGGLTITAFPKFHDACDPHSFMVSFNGINVGVFTDCGIPCELLINSFMKCHAAFLESNYDAEMLDKGSYPYFLKNRIRGGRGHLANHQAVELFIRHRPAHMSHLILSHLSKNNNCPELVQKLFEMHATGVKIVIAGRYQETELYEIKSAELVTTKTIVQAPVFSQLQFAF